MMALLKLFGEARPNDGEVGDAVEVDDGIDGRGLVEVGPTSSVVSTYSPLRFGQGMVSTLLVTPIIDA